MLFLPLAAAWWCAPDPGRCHGHREKLAGGPSRCHIPWELSPGETCQRADGGKAMVDSLHRERVSIVFLYSKQTGNYIYISYISMNMFSPYPSNDEARHPLGLAFGRLGAPYVVDWDEDGNEDLLIGDHDGRVRPALRAIGLLIGFPGTIPGKRMVGTTCGRPARIHSRRSRVSREEATIPPPRR